MSFQFSKRATTTDTLFFLLPRFKITTEWHCFSLIKTTNWSKTNFRRQIYYSHLSDAHMWWFSEQIWALSWEERLSKNGKSANYTVTIYRHTRKRFIRASRQSQASCTIYPQIVACDVCCPNSNSFDKIHSVLFILVCIFYILYTTVICYHT